MHHLSISGVFSILSNGLVIESKKIFVIIHNNINEVKEEKKMRLYHYVAKGNTVLTDGILSFAQNPHAELS